MAGVASLPGRRRCLAFGRRRLTGLRCGVGRLGWLGRRIADVCWHRLACAVVTTLTHPPAQLRNRGTRRIEEHRGGLRHRVDLQPQYARLASQPGGHHVLLRGPQQPAHIQHHGAAMPVVTHAAAFPHFRSQPVITGRVIGPSRWYASTDTGCGASWTQLAEQTRLAVVGGTPYPAAYYHR